VRRPDGGSDLDRSVERNAAGEFVDVGLPEHFPVCQRRLLRAGSKVDGRRDLRAVVGQERDGDRALDLPEHQAQRTEALLGAQLRELHGVGGQAGRVQARGHLRGNALGDEARRRDLRRSRTLLERTPRYPEADPSCPDQRKHGDRNDDEEGARADAHLLRLYQQGPAAHESCRRKHAPLA